MMMNEINKKVELFLIYLTSYYFRNKILLALSGY